MVYYVCVEKSERETERHNDVISGTTLMKRKKTFPAGNSSWRKWPQNMYLLTMVIVTINRLENTRVELSKKKRRPS